jgi:hypothetical protein
MGPTALDIASVVLISAGIGARLGTTRRWIELHKQRYGGLPPRSWMIHSVADPEVEKWRRRNVLGTLLVVAGIVVLFFQILAAGPEPRQLPTAVDQSRTSTLSAALTRSSSEAPVPAIPIAMRDASRASGSE